MIKRTLISVSLTILAQIVYSDNNCKIWNDFINSQKENRESILLDFSYAGYRHGEKEFPSPNYKIFNICDYGAIANDENSDKEAIVKAIQAAEKNGSGIIFFPKGRYILNYDKESSGPIYISNSNIIFRGEGSGADGSEIFMKHYNEAVNPSEKWTSPSLFTFNGRSASKRITGITANSPKGSFSVKVKNRNGLKPGDWVCLRLSNNSHEAIAKELKPYDVEYDWSSMLLNGVQVYDYHQIKSINENVITFKEPLMKEVTASEGWFIESFPHIEEIGIEDLAFVGNWKEKFIHHKDFIHDGGWKFIEFKNTVNSWVTRCRFTDISEAVVVTTSANVSVTDCVINGNIGHNSIHAQASSRSFFGGILDIPAQWHSVGVAKHTMGTVIWRTNYSHNSCFESHASQPRATLIDACSGGFMRGRAGGAIQNNPNHLSDLVLWNFNETDSPTKEFDFWADDTPYWRFMPPVIVGFHGNGTTFKSSQVQYEESTGTPVDPESLYEAQLCKRLGKLPKWITNLKTIVENNAYSGNINHKSPIKIASVKEIESIDSSLSAGDTLLIADGYYNNFNLEVKNSGLFCQPIVIKAEHPGKVVFGNNTNLKFIGNHIKIYGISFNDSVENNKASHKECLIYISGDYCEISECLFNYAKSFYNTLISTISDSNGKKGAAYSKISRCSFINNNASTLIEHSAKQHRISRCYFGSNDSNQGNYISIGNNAKEKSKCLIENNIFSFPNSHKHIIKLNSSENVIYNNTFLNCRNELSLKHSFRQVVINNFFLSTDATYNCNGIRIDNNNHIVGANYFALNQTEKSVLNASYNGTEKRSFIINNHFINCRNNIFEISGGMNIAYNKAITEFNGKSLLISDANKGKTTIMNNKFCGYSKLQNTIEGFTEDKNASLRYDDSKIYIENSNNKVSPETLKKLLPFYRTEGIDIDFIGIIKYGPSGSPLSNSQAGVSWKAIFQ